MLQLSELCRLCAQKKRNKLDLFTDQNVEQSKDLLVKISLCLAVQVSREDMLPKMICADCQRTVEQFSAFRIKCHKAEERLNKMLSLIMPNKQQQQVVVTNIKQEHLESDFHENSNNTNLKLDSPKLSESIFYSNLKSVKNVKCEVEETEGESSWNLCNSSTGSDLIQIISEEIVGQHCTEDIKQPQIEVISENFREDFKNINCYENDYICDVKFIPESLLREEEGEINFQCLQENFQIQEVQQPEIFAKIEEPAGENDQEAGMILAVENTQSKSKPGREKSKLTKGVKCKKFNNDDEIDEKYLTLRAGETCEIDLEEMDALIKKKQDPNATFKCDMCSKTFKFFKCLRKHKHWHNSQPEIFICKFCKKENLKSFEFSSLKSLNNHIQRKHLMINLNKCSCDLCSQTFSSRSQLNAHYKKVHDDSGADCRICGKKFKNSTRLNCHLVVHQDERPYICDQCGQTFKWSNALKVHIQWHKQEKNFLCSECGKKFTAKKNLIEHLNTHSGKRPYVCEVCKASFVQFSAYSKHLYLHNEGKRIHKCDKCDNSYSHAYMLKQHLIRHTNLRPHECSTCHRTFKSQSDLCCHVKIHQEKQYGCQVCGRKFALSKTLRDHMVRHTGIKHRCPVPGCGKSYSQRFTLTKHFCKEHPSLTIVKKKKGKKASLSEKSATEKDGDNIDFIRYDFKAKELEEELMIN